MMTVAILSAALDGDVQTVPLKSGQLLVGRITEKTGKGIVLEKWDGTGQIEISWSQIPQKDLSAFQGPSATEVKTSKEPVVEGVRLITAYRVLDGLVDREDLNTVWVKARDAKASVPVAKTALIGREKILLKESEIYTPAELLDRRLLAVGEDIKNPKAKIQIAFYAVGLGLVDRAELFFKDAQSQLEKAPDKMLEQDLKELEKKLQELKGRAALKAIQTLAENNKYDEAVKAAEEFLATYQGTPLADENKDLPARLAKERDEFKANREKVMSKKIAPLVYGAATKLLKKAAAIGQVDGAMKAVDGLDKVLEDELAKTQKITSDELQKWWKDAETERAKKKHHATYGSGTWIVKGGQDGGYDSQKPTAPPPQQQPRKQSQYIPYLGGVPGGVPPGAFGGMGNMQGMPMDPNYLSPKQQQQMQPKEPPDTRKKLQTKQEWWASQSTTAREEFLEAYWAQKSALVSSTVKEVTHKCPMCLEAGTMKVQRSGYYIDAICPRCHTAKDEIVVFYY